MQRRDGMPILWNATTIRSSRLRELEDGHLKLLNEHTVKISQGIAELAMKSKILIWLTDGTAARTMQLSILSRGSGACSPTIDDLRSARGTLEFAHESGGIRWTRFMSRKNDSPLRSSTLAPEPFEGIIVLVPTFLGAISQPSTLFKTYREATAAIVNVVLERLANRFH